MGDSQMYTVPSIKATFSPTLGQKYYFLGVHSTSTRSNLGLLIGNRVWRGNKDDAARASIGNVFSTFSGAQALRKVIVAQLKKV